MKNVDAMIDLLEKDFNDEAFSLTWYIICFD
jgi:hypothetical protein